MQCSYSIPHSYKFPPSSLFMSSCCFFSSPDQSKHRLLSCSSPHVLIYWMLVGKHLVNNRPFDPCAPCLSTFRSKWPLNGDVPAGMDVSRLVVQLLLPPLNNRGPPCESWRCLRRDMLIFQVNWAVFSSEPYSWQQLPCRRSDYSPIHGLFCGYDVMNTSDVHDLSATCLCARLNPGHQQGV